MELIKLECTSCGETEERRKLDIYTGHSHDFNMVYVCSVCRGDMREVPEAVEVEGVLCDLKPEDSAAGLNLTPWKVWKTGNNL